MGRMLAPAVPLDGGSGVAVQPAPVAGAFAAATLEQLFRQHYRSLIRLAALLLDDVAACEDVVQDAFVRMHTATLRDPDKALAYLRQAVVNLARSKLRRRLVAQRHAPKAVPPAASAEEEAYDVLGRDAVISALKALPRRQRECIVLRYYGDLSEADIARTLGISQGAVKSYCSRGMTALADELADAMKDTA